MSSNVGFVNGVLNSFIENNHMVHGLGFKYSSSTFSIIGANGRDLSENNPGYICISSVSNPAQSLNFKITSNQGFIDDSGVSTIAGMTFGVTSGVAWNSDIPFFVYLVVNSSDDTVQAMCCRKPGRKTAPPAANIGTPSNPITVSEDDFFSFNDVTVADYAGSPCVYVGCFKMKKTTTADDWTVTTLDNYDGVGKNFDGINFVFPQGQNGAAASSWFSDGGGGAAVSIGGSYIYRVYSDGSCFVSFAGSSVATGAGTGDLRMHIPLGLGLGNNIAPPGHFRYLKNGAPSTFQNFIGLRVGATTPNYMYFTADGASAPLANNAIAGADGDFAGTFRYPLNYV